MIVVRNRGVDEKFHIERRVLTNNQVQTAGIIVRWSVDAAGAHLIVIIDRHHAGLRAMATPSGAVTAELGV